MSEKNSNEGGSDAKLSALTPLLSKVPKGASKIFILTPEILKSLGITNHAGIKRTASKTATNEDVGTCTAIQSPKVEAEGSNDTSKCIERNTSKSESKKHKRTSPCRGNLNKREKISKSPSDGASKSKDKAKIEDDSSFANKIHKEEPLSSTPKLKKTRRKSATQSRQESEEREKFDKKTKEDSKEKSENTASSSRTPRRVVKPKKFDDYIVTDDYVGKTLPKDDFVFTPPAAKRESRKSSLNSKNVEAAAEKSPNVDKKNKRQSLGEKKIPVERGGDEKMVKSNKTVETIKEQGRLEEPKSQSTGDTCSTPPETSTSWKTTKIVKTYERRNSQEQKKNIDGATDSESVRCKDAENGAANLVRKMHTYASPKMKRKIEQENIDQEETLKTEKKNEPVISNKKTDPPLCQDKSVLNQNEKQNVSQELEQIKTLRTSVQSANKSSDKVASSEMKKSETEKIVLENKTKPSELCSSNILVDQSPIESPQTPTQTDKTKKIDILKSNLPKISHPKGDNPPKPSSPKSRTEDESRSTKTHLPRSPDDKEISPGLKTIPGGFCDNSTRRALIAQNNKEKVNTVEPEKKDSTSKSDPTKSEDNKKVIKQEPRTLTLIPLEFKPTKNLKHPLRKEKTTLKTDTPQSVDKIKANACELDKSKLHHKDKTINSKLPFSKPRNKNETIVNKPNTSERKDKKKVIDPNPGPVSTNTNRVNSVSHPQQVDDRTETPIPLVNSPDVNDEDEDVSNSNESVKPEENDSTTLELKASQSQNKKEAPDESEQIISKLKAPESTEKEEKDSLENHENLNEKNDILKLDSTRSSAKENVKISLKATPGSPDHKEEFSCPPDLSKASKEEVTTGSTVQQEQKTRISSDESEVVASKSDSSSSHEKTVSSSNLNKSESPDLENNQSLSKHSTNPEKTSICMPEIASGTENPLVNTSASKTEEIVPTAVPVSKEIELEESSVIEEDSSEKTEDTSVSIPEEIVPAVEVSEVIEPVNESSQIDQVPEETTSTEALKVPRKRGRPRKSIIPKEAPVEDKVEPEDVNIPDDTSPEATPENRRRVKRAVQRDENEIDGKGLSDGSDDEPAMEETVIRRRRGRPPGLTSSSRGRGRGRGRGRRRGRGRGRGRGRVDFEYVPRERSSRDQNTDDGDDSQKSEEIPPEVECAKCKTKMLEKSWPLHNLMDHNDMGWLTGEPEPDFTDEKLLRSVLAAVVRKKRGKGFFKCELCGDTKRSPIGFISHLQFCGKTEDEKYALMVTCPICGNVMMSSSWPIHDRYHRQLDKAREEMKVDVQQNSTPQKEKRKAAEKAATKISEFTDLIKEDGPPAKRQKLSNDQVSRYISRPRDTRNPPNRWRGLWKVDLSTKGKTNCRQPGCNFESDTLESMFEHNVKCPYVPRTHYSCRICKYFHESEKEVMKHVKANHAEGKTLKGDSDFEHPDTSSSSDSDSDPLDDKPSKSTSTQYRTGYSRNNRPPTHVKFLDTEASVHRKRYFTPAIRWTMEFERKHYRLRLFEKLLPNSMKRLKCKDAQDYLPEIETSMRVRKAKKQGNKEAVEWTRYQRFQGKLHDGVPTLFTGGPVWAIAWLPIPAPMYDQGVDQYVAISTHPTMESVYCVGKSYAEKNLIQIWNVGPLNNRKSSDCSEPRLAYGVTHNSGTIWCLEWCPSGCYEHPSFLNKEEKQRESSKRMGLLAAACSDGCVHIFSLPFPSHLDSSEIEEMPNDLPIYDTKPVLTLLTNTAMYEKGQQTWQCMKLNWGKQLGHDTIVAGYSNGYIALWNLNTESPLFVTKRGETTLIDAHQHFFAHGHAISFVHLIPYGDKRFVVSSSYDRLNNVWDLEDTSFPLSSMKRGIPNDGAFLTHWPGYLTAYDDGLGHGNSYYTLLRQTSVRMFPILPSNSATFSVDASDYGNAVGHGTMAGEVLVIFPHHLWNLRDMERDLPKKRWLASSTEVVDFESKQVEKVAKPKSKKKEVKEYDFMPETYEGCKDRFGIGFNNNLLRERAVPRTSRPSAERLAAAKIERYPFPSVNRVSWNPNAWSFLWLCVGYQNGLVRFLNFNSVDAEKEWSKSLPAHAKSMLDESQKNLDSENDNSMDFNSSHSSSERGDS